MAMKVLIVDIFCGSKGKDRGRGEEMLIVVAELLKKCKVVVLFPIRCEWVSSHSTY